MRLHLVKKNYGLCNFRCFATKTSIVFTGCAASPGYYVGKACIIRNLEADIHKYRPGCVLVGRFAEPSWNELINDAGALVLEMGQKVSHGPMIARRSGVPCVSNIDIGNKLWANIADGDEVRGNQGTIEILGKELVTPAEEMDEIDEKREMLINLTAQSLGKIEVEDDVKKLLPPEILEMLDKMDETQLDRDDFGNDDRSDGEESIHADQRVGTELRYPSKPTFEENVQTRYDELNRELIDRKDAQVAEQIAAELRASEESAAAEGEVDEEEESTDYEAIAAKLENEQKASQKSRAAAAKKKENRS